MSRLLIWKIQTRIFITFVIRRVKIKIRSILLNNRILLRIKNMIIYDYEKRY